VGITLLCMTVMFSFSGYLLPWDQLAFWAVTIASNIVASTRELTDLVGITALFDPGGFVRRLLLGGDGVARTLSRGSIFCMLWFSQLSPSSHRSALLADPEE